jgi:hypothetical protein
MQAICEFVSISFRLKAVKATNEPKLSTDIASLKCLKVTIHVHVDTSECTIFESLLWKVAVDRCETLNDPVSQ